MNSLMRFGSPVAVIQMLLDIFFLAFLLYKVYGLLVKTNGMQIIKAVMIIALAYIAALILQLQTLQWLLNVSGPSLVIGFCIVFQPELRKIFLKLGQGTWFAIGSRPHHTSIESVLLAAEQLSAVKRGMLVVFINHTELKGIIETGTRLDAHLSSNLLVTIFGHDTPLHDGAVIVQGGKIIAAGCFLPLSEQYDIKKTFGTRHRAALGVSEQTDAVVLVVSEETGAISLAYDSKLHYNLLAEQLTKTLETELELSPGDITEEDDADAVQGKL